MDNKRRFNLMWRWSVISAGLIALFWTIWALASHGHVPVVTALNLTDTTSLKLPFAISRWWDVAIGPIWSLLLIAIFTSQKLRKNKDWVLGLVSSLVFGLISGLIIGLISSLTFGLISGLIFGLAAVISHGRGIGRWLLAR